VVQGQWKEPYRAKAMGTTLLLACRSGNSEDNSKWANKGERIVKEDNQLVGVTGILHILSNN